jgi:hypothetical protein
MRMRASCLKGQATLRRMIWPPTGRDEAFGDLVRDFCAPCLVESSVEHGPESREKRVAIASHTKRTTCRVPSLIRLMTTPPGFHALSLPLAQLSLAAVLKCGQSPSVHIPSAHCPAFGSFPRAPALCLQDRVVCLRQSPDALFYRAVFPDASVPPETVSARDAETLEWLRDYFQLDVDLVKLYDEWAERDPVFAKLRALREFECSDRIHGRTSSRAPPHFICPSSIAHPPSDLYALRTTTLPHHKNGEITLYTVSHLSPVDPTPQTDNCDWTAYAV